MAITRAQLLKELLPGLNALFGLEYEKYENEHAEIYETENSERSFEEEVKLSGFGAAPVKPEGSAISFDSAQESYTARYNHETVAMGFLGDRGSYGRQLVRCSFGSLHQGSRTGHGVHQAGQGSSTAE